MYAGIKSKILTIQVFLFINIHLCSFLSQIEGLCVCVCVCVPACVCLCEGVCVCEICARLGCNAALSGNSALMFRDNPSVPSSRLEDGTVGLSRNIGMELPLNAAVISQTRAVSSTVRRTREIVCDVCMCYCKCPKIGKS